MSANEPPIANGAPKSGALRLLERVHAESAAGASLDWRRLREEIHEEHERATTEGERVILLTLFKALMDTVERSGTLSLEDLETFRTARLQDYRLLLVKEARIGEDISVELLDEITRREVEDGRMAPDDELRRTAKMGMAAPHFSTEELEAKAAAPSASSADQRTESRTAARRVLAWLSGVFLVLGLIGATFHALDSYAKGAPVVSLTFLVLGTGGVAFLAYLSRA